MGWLAGAFPSDTFVLRVRIVESHVGFFSGLESRGKKRVEQQKNDDHFTAFGRTKQSGVLRYVGDRG